MHIKVLLCLNLTWSLVCFVVNWRHNNYIIIQVHILFNINHIAVNVNSWGFNIHNRIVTFKPLPYVTPPTMNIPPPNAKQKDPPLFPLNPAPTPLNKHAAPPSSQQPRPPGATPRPSDAECVMCLCVCFSSKLQTVERVLVAKTTRLANKNKQKNFHSTLFTCRTWAASCDLVQTVSTNFKSRCILKKTQRCRFALRNFKALLLHLWLPSGLIGSSHSDSKAPPTLTHRLLPPCLTSSSPQRGLRYTSSCGVKEGWKLSTSCFGIFLRRASPHRH